MELSSPLGNIKGIGPKTVELLNRAGFFTVRDLLYHLPRTYESYEGAGRISDLRPGKVTVKAKVSSIKTNRKRRNLSITEAILSDDSGSVRAIWFNQPYRTNQFDPNKTYYFSGNFEFSYGRYQLMNPSATLASDYDRAADKYQPVYPACGKLKSTNFTKFFNTIKPFFAQIPDLLPPGTIKTLRSEALFQVHFPKSAADADQGRAYLAFEELFSLLLAGQFNREENQKLRSPVIKYQLDQLKKIIAKLPFKLTNAQRRSTWEIIQNLDSPIPMNRLLQGDVGSGKTLVATLSAFIAAKSGYQTALMAPTEILAAQHAETIHSFLRSSGLHIALLTGSTKNKSTLKKQIRDGQVDLVIGTHALLTDDTIFHKLGLAIIDEQHRFGVKQRQALLAKTDTEESAKRDSSRCTYCEESSFGTIPHLLSMTATPIPRSLQLTVFGDLDISIIDELPKGRQPITTKIISPNSIDQMWQAIENELKQKRQVYYVCKMIEDGTELSSVKKEAASIAKKFPNYKVEYLHGKMKSAEKDNIIAKFTANKINILVSTTVIEVGVNVPNATVMVIADADRYGLSQLHQLRGRVGRGTAESYCYLINSSSSAPTRRLKEIERSQDGFHLAEVDLKLRGPGEIYGSLQHGALDLRIASITDTKLIAAARQAVNRFAKTKPNMLKYKELAASVQKYQRLTTLN
ncbi:ATP-dependent DNA helicase RecG [Candidatus Saccharibacteria bacterium]|nr:ATP-dependent DNA helicase RecG [Candidatus Saccharibacteria bacterium]